MQKTEMIDKSQFPDLTLDFLGSQLSRTAGKNQYLLTIICNSTGWLHAVPMTNCKSQTIADKLLEFFCQVGFPEIIRGDNQFNAKIITELRERLGIKARFSAPHHAPSHGRVERANRTILEMLRKFCHERPSTWDIKLPYFLFALREISSASTGFSPFELTFGRKPRGLLTLM